MVSSLSANPVAGIMIRVYYHPGFAAPLGNHIMPMKKFAGVAQELSGDPSIEILAPNAIQEDDLLRVHSKNYVHAIQTGEPRGLAESQKFPWSKDLYPSVLLTNGGVLAAASEALQNGSSAALASGFHHAHRDRGEGFCTFNGLVVAFESLRSQGKLVKAAVLDLDLHYGNGTALLANDRPWLFVLSIYGNDYWNNKSFRDTSILQHEDGINHLSAPLPAGCNRETLLETLENHLPSLLKQGRPDLILYQAGADPYYEDPYSPLSLDHDDLLERDRMVFQFCYEKAIPVAWVLAGGYTSDLSKVVRVHTNTFKAWQSVYEE